VTEATAPAPKEPSPRRGVQGIVADPALAAVGLYTIVALAAAVAAYYSIFTLFQPYDDEGTLLVTLKAFAHGATLYRDVYSEYGPFYYEAFGGLFALSGHAVTTDASRSIVIVIWVATSFLFGLSAQRLTGSLMLGVTGMIAAFASLYVLINEPMHPQVLCVLLLGAFTLLATLGPSRRAAWAGGGAGALLAALILTKINLGAFAIAAVALAAVLTVEPLHRRRWLRWAVIAAVLALPVFVAARDVSAGWVRDFIALEALAMAAIVVAAWPLGSRPRDGDDGVGRWLLGAAVGFGLAFVAIMAAIVLDGSSLADVYDGVITEAMRVRDVLLLEFPSPPAAVDWAVAAVAAAALATRLRPGAGDMPSIWPGLLRAVAGLTIWYSVARIAPLGLNPSTGNPDSLPMVLAWVAAIPPAGSSEPPYKRFLRVLLPALAVAETLQVYPVAGSQTGIASLTFVPVGALCLGDALTSLRSWSEARGAHALERFGAVAGIVSVALMAQFALDSIVRPTASNAVTYGDQPALPIAGAGLLHIPGSDAETYASLVDLLHRYRCTTFIGYPSINSLYLWSSIEAPLPTAPGAWVSSLDAERQQRIVDEMRASPRPCAIRSDSRAELWLHGAPPPERPLVRYVFNDFKPVEEVGEFEFMLPKATIDKP
jgi:hypothetical protein